MNRRKFIHGGIGAAAAAALAAPGSVFAPPRTGTSPAGAKFKLRYAPSIGQFKAHAGTDPAAQIRFAADEGFTAMFDNGIMNRPPAEQEAIVREIAARDMILGPFVLYADFAVESFVLSDKDIREMLLEKMRQGVETMKRTNVTQALVVPGRYNERLAWEYQTANVIENLRACMDVCEPAGLVLVLEPLNPARPSGPLPDEDRPGLRHLPGREEPELQDPRRHLPPADHRGRPHPEHRRLLGRDRRLPHRRQSRPQGADDRRDQLSERLQAHPRQGIHGRPVHGARPEQAGQGRRAGRDRRLPGLRRVSKEDPWSIICRQHLPARFHQDDGGRLARRGHPREPRAPRPGLGRDPHRRHRLRRPRRRERPSTP